MSPEQPLGDPVEFSGTVPPSRIAHRGTYATVRPLEPDEDAPELYAISHAPTGDPSIWTYLYDGPYPSFEQFRENLGRQAASDDPLFFTITPAGAQRDPLGIVTYMSIVPEHGTIELGNIWFGPQLKRTPAATEAIFLLARHAFDDLGYRRLEWKCNALNASVTRGGVALRLRVSRASSTTTRGQGPQPRHRLVRDHRRALAGAPDRLRDLAAPPTTSTHRGSSASAWATLTAS